MVAVPTPDLKDKSLALHRNKARAARIWPLEINLNYLYYDFI
jgi:hypothetical protein